MPTPNDNNQPKEINLRELFLRYIDKWYWFLISIAVCVGFMVLHILTTTPPSKYHPLSLSGRTKRTANHWR